MKLRSGKNTTKPTLRIGDLLLVDGVMANNLVLVKTAIRLGADVTADDSFALRWAISEGFTEIKDYLLTITKHTPRTRNLLIIANENLAGSSGQTGNNTGVFQRNLGVVGNIVPITGS